MNKLKGNHKRNLALNMLTLHSEVTFKVENSLRYSKMPPDELAKEFDESTKRFIERMGKDTKIVSLNAPT